MKILIIGMYTRTFMPYINKYEKVLEKNKIEYEVTCFDRENTGKLSKEGNTYYYRKQLGTSKVKKLIPYAQYFLFVQKLIKKEKYDKLIVLTTIPGVFLKMILTGKYKNNYIFDYRDISFEYLSWYKNQVNDLIEKSFTTFLSSKGFKAVLETDSSKIKIVHNIPDEYHVRKASKLSKPIVIGFVGYVRYYEINKKLINTFANDDNYLLKYVGLPYDDCDLEGYCREQDIQNIYFQRRFENEEKEKIYEEIDIINSLYDISSKEVFPAIPNRLYDAAIYRKPLIVTEGTYLAEVVRKYELGCVIDIYHSNIKLVLEEYLQEFDEEQFEKNCHDFLQIVKSDEEQFEKILQQFLR